jgi:transcriptional regulator with GAF, ATPase, and Fis domain
MRELFAVLERVATAAQRARPGRHGTGKEEVARAVHARSLRSEAPFAVLDATTIPATLAESVLFGHERGAFTGADARYQGAFERANGGTLFIDEVGELPMPLQPKLLRVLERRELTRVGGKEVVPIDVRVIAATHRDLRLEIEANHFREDLYFRLAQVRVVLPPLRARPEDIPDLAHHFCACRRTRSKTGDDRRRCSGRAAPSPFSGQRRSFATFRARRCAFEDGCIRRARHRR